MGKELPVMQDRVHKALQDRQLQANLQKNLRHSSRQNKREKIIESVPDWERLREYGRHVKQHTLSRLPDYLEELEKNVIGLGGKVIWAQNAEYARNFILQLIRDRDIRSVVKSKSMTTEEIALNPALEREGARVIETDLGEYIIQIAGQKPSHILGPSIHLSKDQISDLFYREHGPPKLSRAEDLTAEARQKLRREFLRAGMGITGVNFGIADSGTLVLVENEGNIFLTVSKPRIHVAVMGIEKVIPRLENLPNFLKLLIHSASGQRISSYVNLISGPRRPGEIDGPEELYLILLDNGRSGILSDPFLAQTLSCIRCGACLNSCPVYQNIGGHAYASTYQGPIGAILTPQLESLEAAPEHPFASSLCGACGEVCPVKIEIPQILLKLREKIRKAKDRKSGSIQLQKLAFQIWGWCMQRPARIAGVMRVVKFGQKILLKKGHRHLPVSFLRRWVRYHELPKFPEKTFREMYAEKEGS